MTNVTREDLPKSKLYYLYYFENKYFENLYTSNVLDFGCGEGDIVVVARSMGYNFFGCETFYDKFDCNLITNSVVKIPALRVAAIRYG